MTERRLEKRRGTWQRLRGDRWSMLALGVLSAVALACLGAPLLPLPDPNQTALSERLLTPLSAGHLLGTDQLGRDMLSRLLHGARLSLAVAFLGVSVATVLGSLVGIVAGYFQGALDNAVMRGIDVLMAFPYLLLALAIVVVLGPGLENATLAIAIVNVPFFARTVRGHTLSLGRAAFVDAARVAGLGDARILATELLPALGSTLVVTASTSTGWMLLETAGLSFLGLGAQPPTADLGGMLGQGRQLLATAPHVSLIPGAFIFGVVAMFNLLGDGLRDALDPRHSAGERGRAHDEPPGERVRREPEKVNDPLLTVEALSVRFGDTQAVRNVGFSLARGEKLGLVGESGSGKSVTALSVLSLLDGAAHVRGTIRFDDLALQELPPSELDKLRGARMAWIPQDPTNNLHPLFTIGRQLVEGLERHGRLTPAAARKRARELLEEVDIADAEGILQSFPNQLSGGMRQRVAIAMALSGDPELLVADEPTTALDVTTQATVLDCLNRLVKRRGAALLFISHDLAVVSQLCDRILVMRGGRVVEEGPVGDVLRAPENDYTERLLRSVPRLGDPAHILKGETS